MATTDWLFFEVSSEAPTWSPMYPVRTRSNQGFGLGRGSARIGNLGDPFRYQDKCRMSCLWVSPDSKPPAITMTTALLLLVFFPLPVEGAFPLLSAHSGSARRPGSGKLTWHIHVTSRHETPGDAASCGTNKPEGEKKYSFQVVVSQMRHRECQIRGSGLKTPNMHCRVWQALVLDSEREGGEGDPRALSVMFPLRHRAGILRMEDTDRNYGPLSSET